MRTEMAVTLQCHPWDHCGDQRADQIEGLCALPKQSYELKTVSCRRLFAK